MARLARAVAPGLPHNVTQQGNRRQQTISCAADYRLYIELMTEWCTEGGVEIWLAPNLEYEPLKRVAA